MYQREGREFGFCICICWRKTGDRWTRACVYVCICESGRERETKGTKSTQGNLLHGQSTNDTPNKEEEKKGQSRSQTNHWQFHPSLLPNR